MQQGFGVTAERRRGTPVADILVMQIPLSVTDVTRIANEAVRAEHAALDVVGVTFGEGGGKYTEVLLRVQDCQAHPCQISLGVFRDVGESALREEIARKVRQHVLEHSASDAHAAAHASPHL